MLEVRFIGYKCNTGCGDNGNYSCKEKFEKINESVEFIRYVINLIIKHETNSEYSKKDYSFLEKYDIDFVTKFVGLFEVYIMERKIHINNLISKKIMKGLK